MEPAPSIAFRASFPPIQSAFKRHGGGDGFRIQFDIPECDMLEAAALMALTGVVLRVTVEVADSDEVADVLRGDDGSTISRRSAKRRA